MTKILTAILRSIVNTNPAIAAFMFVSTFVMGAFEFASSLWSELLAKIAAIALPPSAAASAIDVMSFLNFFLPVTEVFAFGTAYMALYALCAAIRIIKSFIPTIS